ncbi:MAG: YggT family protein [Clostridium sp.]
MFVNLLSKVLETTILIEVILSFIPSVGAGGFYNIIKSFNYPILEPFRRLQQNLFGMSTIDFSPIFAILFIGFARKIIFTLFL